MSLHRFFLEEGVLSESEDGTVLVRLAHDDIKHFRAARISPGEHVAIVDADRDYFECEVLEIADSGFAARIAAHEGFKAPSFAIDLFQGIPKAGKLEDVVRHGTEIGIDAFHPLICKRSVRKLDKGKSESLASRLRKIAKSAAMQSGRSAIPSVSMPYDLQDALKDIEGYDSALVFWEEAPSSCTLACALEGAKRMIEDGRPCRICAIVGPEGGLSDEEVSKMKAFDNAHLCTLGPNILRTETAGVVGCALISYELGGMGAAL